MCCVFLFTCGIVWIIFKPEQTCLNVSAVVKPLNWQIANHISWCSAHLTHSNWVHKNPSWPSCLVRTTRQSHIFQHDHWHSLKHVGQSQACQSVVTETIVLHRVRPEHTLTVISDDSACHEDNNYFDCSGVKLCIKWVSFFRKRLHAVAVNQPQICKWLYNRGLPEVRGPNKSRGNAHHHQQILCSRAALPLVPEKRNPKSGMMSLTLCMTPLYGFPVVTKCPDVIQFFVWSHQQRLYFNLVMLGCKMWVWLFHLHVPFVFKLLYPNVTF